MSFPYISAVEAANLIKDGDIIGLSGFTPAGSPKAVTSALAQLAEEKHARGEHFQVGIITGASTGDSCDGALTRAHAMSFRAPYTTNTDFRKAVNKGEIRYTDIHLSQVAQRLRSGFLGHVNVAIIEACEITDDGRIYLTSGVGISPTVARLADKVIVELNAAHSKRIIGIHDLYEMERPPYRRPLMIERPSDRIGLPYIQVDGFSEPDAVTEQIGHNVAAFLANDMRKGTIPSTFLPLQSGVGNIANAVLSALGKDSSIPPFEMYTEVIQNSVIKLIKEGRIKFGSTCSLSVTNDCLQDIYENMDFFINKLVLRPSEISNCPEVVRRIGVISMNTAHICGTKMMNGIGGSGDFTRSAYISIFSCPSTAKGGCISSIVPMVSHQDHSEHSVNIIITEQGIADLRGKSPMERAKVIIENCAHPDYKQILWDYLRFATKGQTSHCLSAALAMHEVFLKEGDMRLIDWAKFIR